MFIQNNKAVCEKFKTTGSKIRGYSFVGYDFSSDGLNEDLQMTINRTDQSAVNINIDCTDVNNCATSLNGMIDGVSVTVEESQRGDVLAMTLQESLGSSGRIDYNRETSGENIKNLFGIDCPLPWCRESIYGHDGSSESTICRGTTEEECWASGDCNFTEGSEYYLIKKTSTEITSIHKITSDLSSITGTNTDTINIIGTIENSSPLLEYRSSTTDSSDYDYIGLSTPTTIIIDNIFRCVTPDVECFREWKHNQM